MRNTRFFGYVHLLFMHTPQLYAGDTNPLTLELSIGFFYAYEQETAISTNEYDLIRPVEMQFVWKNDTYIQTCQYFTDHPTQRLLILHSAETRRVCGMLRDALPYYERLADDFQIAEWKGLPWLIYPEGVTDEEQKQYANTLERAYYRSFALFRLVQISILVHSLQGAYSVSSPEYYLSQLQNDYSPGNHGYEYAAMASAYVDEFTRSGNTNSACASAAAAQYDAITSGDDPGIDYLPV